MAESRSPEAAPSSFPQSAIRNPKSTVSVVFVGHVDHGKSTLIGRILAETGSLAGRENREPSASCVANGRAVRVRLCP